MRRLRSLLRTVLVVAVVLAVVDAFLLALRLGGWLQPDQALWARVFSAIVSLALLTIVFGMKRRLDRALADADAATRQLDQARREAERARAQLADAIEALPATFELYDSSDRLVMWNRALAQAYPHMAPHLARHPTFEELARLNLANGGQPDYADRPDEWVALRQAQRRSSDGSARPLLSNGRGGWLRLYETRLSDGGMVAIRVDVTAFEEKRRALDEVQQELERSRQLLRDAIDAMPAGFELYDPDDRLVLVNRKNLQMYPQLADLIGHKPTFEEVVRANAARGGLPVLQTPTELDEWIAQRQRERREPNNVRVHRIEEGRWVRVHERRMSDGGTVAIRLDISDLMQREAELTELSRRLEQANQDLSVLSRTDALTGLANRRLFDLRLGEEVAHAVRHDMPLALLLVDVDHFKRYNDLYGHPAGDECLRRVAEVLHKNADRPTDLVARLGGEEFALLLPHQTARAALLVAQRCVADVAAAAIPHAESSAERVVTISIGVADLSSAETSTPAALLAAADAAMYRAKQQGRNRVA